MKRRAFLNGLALTAVSAGAGFRLPFANAAEYEGKLFAFVQADGGWDPTSFCDPKANTLGERVINHWAERDETRQAGNIPYAPFANNETFFEKYHSRMLVINGVDAQTNSHTVGVVHNWSGRNAEGYPTLASLLASQLGPALPMSYISFGGYSETGGLTRYTRLHNPELLRSVAYPRDELSPYFDPYFSEEAWHAMATHREARAKRLADAGGLLLGEARNLAFYQSAMASSDTLKAFADAIPSRELLEQPAEARRGNDVFRSELRRQAQLAVLAFKTGAAVSSDLYLGGFDTHVRNDEGQEWLLGNLTDSVDFLWDYAEVHGVADRMVVVIGSDFGRTNFYNSDDGKDHWPIGSYVVMEKNQPWTNRVVGETDELHFAKKINPATLERDDANGTIVYPKHVHKALRRYLGIEFSAGALRFPFSNTEDFEFFSASVEEESA